MERWLRMTRQSGLEFARGNLPEMRAGSQDRAIGRVLERQDPALVSLKGTSSLPVLTSERQTPFRKLLPTRVLPSGAKATELKSMRSAANRCSSLPVASSQRRIVESLLPDASHLPSGDRGLERTVPEADTWMPPELWKDVQRESKTLGAA